ncbi:MAG: GAP family protein [Solirubrobacterales bacterium]
MSTQILPLAITMLIGPGIMAAIILVTTERPVPVSLAYVLGFTISTALGVAAATGLASLLGSSTSLGSSSDSGSAGTIIQIVLVVLLIALSVKQYLGRATAEPPKWLGTLMEADPRRALRMGLLIVVIMPSDILIMLTVGMNLEHTGSSLVDAIPFVALTALVAALPLLAYLLFRHRAQRAMPKVRDWMNTHSWLVNIIVFVIFIALILF